MSSDDRHFDDLKKTADSYMILSELADRLQNDYQELSQKFTVQSRQLEDINSQLNDAVAINGQLSAYLNNTLENLDAGVIVIDHDGRINLFNQAAENLTGIDRNKALSYNYRDIFAGDEHQATYDLLAGDSRKVRGEKWFGHQPVGYSANRIFDRTGQYWGVVEILYDISAEKKLRETIRHVSALAAVGEMAATVAHQVRNPLAGIIGFTDLLKRDLQDRSLDTRLADKILRGAQELNRIITGLLDFTRKTEPDYRELDIVKFAEEIAHAEAKEPYAQGIKFDYESTEKEYTYRFDPLLLRQALTNLIHNACQAMEPGKGELKLTIEIADDKYLEIAVADTGKGIREGDVEKIFQPFYTTRASGVGLGLSMVKKAIDFHNGIVTAFNKKSGGAVFVIKLPL